LFNVSIDQSPRSEHEIPDKPEYFSSLPRPIRVRTDTVQTAVHRHQVAPV